MPLTITWPITTLFRPIGLTLSGLCTLCLLTLCPHQASAQTSQSEFTDVQQALERHGFTVNLALPPQPGTYGLLHTPTRTIWINPVVFDLEIAVPTLVHEAVHAAQLCGSSASDILSPLALGLEPSARAYQLYMRYTGTRRTIEAEAYTVQARADRVTYVINLLDNHC